MLDTAMETQQQFIEMQFTGLNGRLDEIKKDLAGCSKAIGKLHNDHNDLCKKVDKAEKTTTTIKTKLTDYEANLADLEDRSRWDNVRILGIPEGMEG